MKSSFNPASSFSRNRSVTLDLVRVGAAIWVVCYHWAGFGGFSPDLVMDYDTSWVPLTVKSFSQLGFLGVDVFFLLSGAVIALSALGKPWSAFAQNRFLRIFPTYLLAVILVIFIRDFAAHPSGRASALSSLSGLQLWIGGPSILGAAWTLAVEVWFYGLVTFLIWRTKILTAEKVRLAAMVFMVISIAVAPLDFKPLDYLVLGNWAGYFALGALLSVTRNKDELRKNALGLLVGGVLAGTQLYKRVADVEHHSVGFAIAVAGVILVGVSGTILWSSFRASGRSSNHKRLRRSIEIMALMTYPLYLLNEHFGISAISLLTRQFGSPQLSTLGVAILLLALCLVIVRYFEPWSRRAVKSGFGWNKPTVDAAHGRPVASNRIG